MMANKQASMDIRRVSYIDMDKHKQAYHRPNRVCKQKKT